MNKNSKHLALLGITNFYEISSDYIYKLREKIQNQKIFFLNYQDIQLIKIKMHII